MNSIEKIYLAGPLFTAAELQWNKHVAKELKKLGFQIWLPQEHEPVNKNAKAIFEKDIEGLDWADATLANLDGADPDSGTSWEMGYTYANKKPVFWYRTDKRTTGDSEEETNLMLTQSGLKINEWKDLLHFIN